MPVYGYSGYKNITTYSDHFIILLWTLIKDRCNLNINYYIKFEK